MATRTFGRRTAIPGAVRAPLRQAATAPAPAPTFEPAEPSAFDVLIRDNKLVADLPYLTVGLIIFLILIYCLERHFAIDIGKGGTINLRSLIAFGAVSRDLVIGTGEWWRIGLAPLLHASMSHIVGNSIALFFVGVRLEPMIGRGWLLLIFVASALGGAIGSLYGNAPGMPSVGASGAITGLIGALFVVSFNPYADPDHQRAMRKTALRFGVPALLPLAFGASGGVDYFAHAGGALAGAALGVVLCVVWSHDSIRPTFARQAGLGALAGFAGALVCAGFAVMHFAAYTANGMQFMRAADLPSDIKSGAQQSAMLVSRYPKDPRAHLMRAVYYVGTHELGEAETELRAAMTLSSADVAGGPVRAQAQAILAAVLSDQGRHGEAKALAAEGCRAGTLDPMRIVLAKAKLCS
jgi:membrane associated rhomboid family serine protease